MHHPFEVRSSNGSAGVFATAFHPAGSILLTLRGTASPRPDRYSIQIGPHEHLMPDETTAWRFMNHACEPTTRIDVEDRVVRALRDIAPGEELTFDYTTTEWELAAPFECLCESASCYGKIQGFNHLPAPLQQALLPETAPHIQQLYAEQQVEAAEASGKG